MAEEAPSEEASPPQSTELTIDQALQAARQLALTKHDAEAEDVLRAVLAVVPDHPTALNYLGILTFKSKGAAYSAEILEKAAAAAPDNPFIRNNLGNTYVELKRIDDAVAQYENAIALKPDMGDPYLNLASIWRSRGDFARTEELLRTAIQHSPENPYAHMNLGSTLVDAGKHEEALPHFVVALREIKSPTATLPLLAMSCWMSGRKSEALETVNHWIERMPNDPQARHLHAAFTGKDVPARASNDYIERLFDNFSTSFDAKLDSLGYRAPQLVGEALLAAVGSAEGKLSIIDAGCGTGKCGQYLRPVAADLTGVDLSNGMLDRARMLGLYDELVQSELTAYLAAVERPRDAIASADTLCYFGDLKDFSAAAHHALKPGGVLVFTVEAIAEQDQDSRLAYHGRYGHSRRYVTQTLTEAGFDVERCVDDELRMEALKPVAGLVVTARRPVAAS